MTAPIQTTCIRCINLYREDGRCPMHASCDEYTCNKHQPHWNRFCTQATPLSSAQRQHLRRWVVDVSPGNDVTYATVAAMSDPALCAELARIDTEWRRPPLAPENFECDDSDFMTSVEFSDVPHEVLGTFATPASKAKCADIRGVDHWLKAQDRRKDPRTVPQFHTQDNLPYFQALTREWEGRMRFANEQHSKMEMTHDVFDLIETIATDVGGGLTDMTDKELAVKKIIRLLNERSARDREIVADHAIAPLVSLLRHYGTPSRYAAEALYYIARDGHARLRQIAHANATKSLVAMLTSPIDGAYSAFNAEKVKWASLVLHKLTTLQSTRALVVQAGAVIPLAEALKVSDIHSDIFAASAFALANIANDATHATVESIIAAGAMASLVQSLALSQSLVYRRSPAAFLIFQMTHVQQGRDTVLAGDGIVPLVALLAAYGEHQIGADVTRALANLAVDDKCRLAMISAQAVDALQIPLRFGNEDVKTNARTALARLR
jgi:hypothetical protein